MKNKFILLSLLFISTSLVYSQQMKIYYNEDWEITTKDSATYFRLAEYNNRIFNGNFEDYYITGELQATGNYFNGQETGPATWYFKNGKILCEGYNSTGNFSIDTGYDTLGNMTVENGTGYFVWYNAFNNTKSSEGKYSYGKKEGQWSYYNSEGTKIEEFDYDKNVILNAWDYTGKKLLIENGNGNYIRYYRNGKVKVKGKYVDGKQEGIWTWYHENGDIDCTGNYSNGKKEGVWSFYYDQNKLKEKSRYKNDELNGIFMTWHRNGNQSNLGYYESDLRRGKWVWFNEDGSVKSKMNYGEGFHF